MIDWHCHILPNLDDGAASLDESIAMARLLSSVGFTHICCTPHRLRGMYDTAPVAMREGLDSLQAVLQQQGIPLTLVAGMEYCLDEFFIDDFSSEPVPLGTSKKVLVETPANADPQLLRENIFHLVRSGYVPLFAHPERHAFLAPPARKSGSMFGRVKSWVAEPAENHGDRLEGTLLDELKMMGCDFQGNLGSVGGYYGSLVKAQEQRLRQAGILTCYGSDGHNAASLKQFVCEALQELQTDQPFLLQTAAEFVAS